MESGNCRIATDASQGASRCRASSDALTVAGFLFRGRETGARSLLTASVIVSFLLRRGKIVQLPLGGIADNTRTSRWLNLSRTTRS
jgi:hypothetical protein